MSSKLLYRFIVAISLLAICGCAPELDGVKASYKKVTQIYEGRLKKHPGDLKLRIKLAEFYYEFKDYSKVKQLLDKIDAQQAKVLLAKALAKNKQYDYAIELFEQLKDKIKDPEYLYLYGGVLENKNLFPKALQIYKKVPAPFKAKAQERIQLIESKTETATPAHIQKLYKEAKHFLKDIEDEAAIILYVDEETQIRPDNTSVSTLHVIEQVLQERGKELAEVEIGYDSTYERVSLEFARTVGEEGGVVYAGQQNIRDVSRYLNFPLYSNAKAFIVSMPMVEVGSFIEYKIKLYSSKLVDEDDFSFLYRLRERYPIFKAEFRLEVPKNREVNFKLFNKENAAKHKLTPVVKKKKDKHVYTWKFSKIKPLIPEYNMPPVSEVNPAVLMSSFSSWEQIYKWWRSLYQDKFELDKETEKFVNKLVKGTNSDKSKAKRIYEFCAEHIRYVAVEYGESGHQPHAAQEVFLNRYGDCKDQAILLVAMLKSVGVKGYPVLIPTRNVYPIDKEFPSINFNHAICAADVDGKLIFMDPTAETTSFLNLPLGDQGRTVMVFMEDSWQITETPQITDNRILCKMNIKLNDKENAVIEREVTTSGFFSSAHRAYLKYTHPSKIKEDIQKKMVQISSFSRLIDYKIENLDVLDAAPVLRYKFATEKFLNPAGHLRVIPALSEIQIAHNIIGKEERIFPIDFEGIYSEEAEIEVMLPQGLRIKYLPKDINLQNRWFEFNYSYKKLRAGLEVRQNFSVRERFIQQEDYKEFKKELEKVLYFLREEVILEKR
ncbi:MAG: DUF3857 domain-containing protein [Candidatus Omnitrophota bacterium]|nr:MAG: DUF3857 domain-containing protein [Candidatus Omnitrophota bacterium]